jgi:hypothetical protein
MKFMQLPRRQARCILEGELFEQGSEYISLLDFSGNRKDYCPACWQKVVKPLDGHFWRGKVPHKQEKTQVDEKALTLFSEIKEPKLRFVLALYLQRKRQLIRRTKTLFEIPDTGELFDIEPFFLSAEEGEHCAYEIEQLLTVSA